MITQLEIRKFKRFDSSKLIFREKGLTMLVGANNSGKSSVLHALAIWEFCKTYIKFEKGFIALTRSYSGQGIGLDNADFSVLSIPDPKHLWTNLKVDPGYTLTLKVSWVIDENVKFLEIALALNLGRLFFKTQNSNLTESDKIPRIAYLPPFAGISPREGFISKAERQRLIGSGLAGAILRNSIIELFNKNKEDRETAKGASQRLRGINLISFRQNDPFEILQSNLLDLFQINLVPQTFNPDYHSYIKVEVAKGSIKKNRFIKFTKFTKRDIMMEGSGFLQWLSVYTYALTPDVDVLLLDEPDAHLHFSLQSEIIKRLEELSQSQGKQIIMASHSTEIVKSLDYSKIFHVRNNTGSYLKDEEGKISVLAGLGTDYSPKIELLAKYKRLIITENESDINLLKIWFEKLQISWPTNLVYWPWPNRVDQRKALHNQLQSSFSGTNKLITMSLNDRDDRPYSNTNQNLSENGNPDISQQIPGGNSITTFYNRLWRRRSIENYLLSIPTISRISGKSHQEIETWLTSKFSLTYPNNEFIQSERTTRTTPLFDYHAKEITTDLESHFKFNKFDLAREMREEEICDDVKTLINDIVKMCS